MAKAERHCKWGKQKFTRSLLQSHLVFICWDTALPLAHLHPDHQGQDSGKRSQCSNHQWNTLHVWEFQEERRAKPYIMYSATVRQKSHIPFHCTGTRHYISRQPAAAMRLAPITWQALKSFPKNMKLVEKSAGLHSLGNQGLLALVVQTCIFYYNTDEKIPLNNPVYVLPTTTLKDNRLTRVSITKLVVPVLQRGDGQGWKREDSTHCQLNTAEGWDHARHPECRLQSLKQRMVDYGCPSYGTSTQQAQWETQHGRGDTNFSVISTNSLKQKRTRINHLQGLGCVGMMTNHS